VWNIIPDQVKLQLTVRSLNPDVHKKLLAAIARVGKGEALAMDAPKEPLIETKSSTDAVYNDPELTQRAVAAARAALGAETSSRCRRRWARKTSLSSALRRARRTAAHRRRGCGETRGIAKNRRAGSRRPSALWAPVREPTIRRDRCGDAILMDLLK